MWDLFNVPNSLHRCLLGRRECDQCNPDNDERWYVTKQVSVFTRILECLHRHNCRVNETRPGGESD
jgi:hypothetical protein